MNLSSDWKSWGISLTGALFFFYAFFQVNLMTPLSAQLLLHLHLNSAQLGLLSAVYFYGNVLFLLPAGLLLDRFPTKQLMLFNMGLAILGTLIFAVSSTLFFAALGRFLCGVMMSFGLIICLKVAGQLLPAEKMALASSLIIMIGMLGGIFAQAPFSLMILLLGWRGALVGASLLGVFLNLILFLVIPSFPVQRAAKEGLSIVQSLRKVFSVRQNWWGGCFISLLNLPIAILGALFGISFLEKNYGLSSLASASIVSMLFLGMILGSPFFGWLSDRMQKRRPAMLLGAFSCLAIMLLLLCTNIWPIPMLYLLFLGAGFTSASQVVGYPAIAESNAKEVASSALSLATIIIMGGGYGLGLPLVGWLLEKSSFSVALWTIPGGIFLSICMVFLMKESYPKSVKEEKLETDGVS